MSTDISDRELHVLVLKKLKRSMHDSSFVSGEARYVYEWNEAASLADNLGCATQEDEVLRHYIASGVIIGEHTQNEYRRQQLETPNGTWSDWLKTDAAHREFYYAVFMYGIDINRFEKEISKFELMDTGTELAERLSDSSSVSLLSEPILSIRDSPAFKLHDAWRISYEGKEIEMQSQVRKVAFLIMKNFNSRMVTTTDMIMRTHDVANAADNVSRARQAFRNATGQDKDFFPSERNVGYRFLG